MAYLRGGFNKHEVTKVEDDLFMPFDLEGGEWEEREYQVTAAAHSDFLLIDDYDFSNYDDAAYLEDYQHMPLFGQSQMAPQSRHNGVSHASQQLFAPQRDGISSSRLSGKQRSTTVTHEARLSSQRQWERPLPSAHQRQRMVSHVHSHAPALSQQGFSRPPGISRQSGVVRHSDIYRQHAVAHQHHASAYPSPPTSPTMHYASLASHRPSFSASMAPSIDIYGEMEDISTRRRSRQL